MDSFTQVALGAAVGEAVLGKKAGNKAVLWGGVAALIPDLDIAILPFLDPIDRLTFHRGISHSITFSFASALFFAFVLHKVYRGANASKWEWGKLAFLSHFTHIMLDVCTVYGTQLFQPFSDYAVAINSIFIIDPVYSLPLMVSVLVLLFYQMGSGKRRILSYLGLGLSTGYLCFTLINKEYVGSVFEASMERQSIEFRRYMTNPAPLQNALWTCIAEGEDAFWIGYYSLFDNDKDIIFQRIDKNHHLFDNINDDPMMKRLIQISNGFYCVRQGSDSLFFTDLRFGSFGGWIDSETKFPFQYKIIEAEGAVSVQRVRLSIGPLSELLDELFMRVKGI